MNSAYGEIRKAENELWEGIGKLEAVIEMLREGAGDREDLIQILRGACGNVATASIKYGLAMEEADEPVRGINVLA